MILRVSAFLTACCALAAILLPSALTAVSLAVSFAATAGQVLFSVGECPDEIDL